MRQGQSWRVGVTNSKLWSKDSRARKLKKLNMVDRAKIRGPKGDFGCGLWKWVVEACRRITSFEIMSGSWQTIQ